jgi:hypothetical protein
MNKSYDVYMCRESESEKLAFMRKRRSELTGLLIANIIKESDVDSLLDYAWSDYLRNKKETERQLADAELLRSSPFDMMPSKLEKRGMMKIFKREYFGRFESEK